MAFDRRPKDGDETEGVRKPRTGRKPAMPGSKELPTVPPPKARRRPAGQPPAQPPDPPPATP